jgi:S1-C subfamily serine protease
VNLLDLVLLVILIGAAVRGVSVGAASQIIWFVGFAIGVWLGALLAPSARSLVSSPKAGTTLVLVTVIGVPLLTTAVAGTLGVRAWSALQRAHLGRLDATGGAIVAVVSSLAAVWLVGSVLASAPNANLSGEVQHSAILRALDDRLPPPPALFARIGRFLDPLGFPQAFAQFEPSPPADLPLPADPVVQAAVAKAGGSVLKIEGKGCGGIQEGSGFVVAPGVVVTNAHVVAGIRNPTVVDKAGTHPAVPVRFDPHLDLAVLEVTGLKEAPLKVASTDGGRGTQGAVMGYPGGGPFQAGPSVILAVADAVGRDIYGQDLTTRSIETLHAVVRPGNSGGPVVDANGTVVGVVFARSTANSDIGYALTTGDVMKGVNAALANPTAVGTDACAA